MRDIVLVGFPGSGKSYIAHWLSLSFCYKVLEIGSFVYAESVEKSLSTYECANKYFSLHQYEHFVKQVIDERKIFSNESFVIVGPRTIQEVEYLQIHLENPILIALNATYNTRQLRRSIQSDKVKDIPLWKRDQLENEWGLTQAILSCQYQIINEYDCHIEDILNFLNNIIEV